MSLPTGPAVTFLFTDIEGSTRLERAVGSAPWAELVQRHDALLRHAIEEHGGVVVKTEGDAFFAAFADPLDALAGAAAGQRALAGEAWPPEAPIQVRMGLHLGQGRLRQGLAAGAPEDYVGIDVNYAARIAAAGNGRQIVISDSLATAVAPRLGSASPAGTAGGAETADRPASLRDVELADEGLRAVKDFDDPLRLHRLVVPGAADDARPLRTTDVPTNLPGEVTAFIGRESELERLRGLLGGSRILTLTGPGGSGKTRLALALANAVRNRFPHGVWFIDLASVRDAAFLEASIAHALGVKESADQPVAEVLRAHLRDRVTLLVLDNLEQLLPSGAEVVARIARDAPGLRALITSRELLRIAGEQGYIVPPLDLSSGVELFEDRARAHRADLAWSEETMRAVRDLCERLGGLPLAIELAAARTRLLTPQQILDRLGRTLDLGGSASRDLPERQRTLRGAIDWSHDLLTAPEQRLFRRLAVFAGGWTFEEATPVVDPEGDLGIDLLEGLESLVDKSLVRVEPQASAHDEEAETRFGMHPLLREYALERLEGADEREAVEARHAAVYVALAERLGKTVLVAGGPAAIRRFDREDHNFRAVLDRSIARAEPSDGLLVMAGIWRWLQQRGRLREGRATLGQLLALPWSGDPRVRIGGLAAEGGLAYWTNDIDGADKAYLERLDLANATGDPHELADAEYDLGFISVVRGDAPRVVELEQRALDLYDAAGDADGVRRARQALVLAVFLSGDYPRARELEMQNLEAFTRAGASFQIADSETLQSAVALRLDEPERGWELMKQGLRFFAENDNASGLARSLGMAAIMALSFGDLQLGGRLAGAVDRLVREKAVMLAPVQVLKLPDPRLTIVEELGPERAGELMRIGEDTDVQDLVAEILGMPAPVAAAVT